MLMRLIVLLSFTTLTACGADGPPEAPASRAAPDSTLTISGCAKVGITAGPKATGPVRC